MSRSRNSRKGSKHIQGCPGCSACDSNWVERNIPIIEVPDDLANTDMRKVIVQLNEVGFVQNFQQCECPCCQVWRAE